MLKGKLVSIEKLNDIWRVRISVNFNPKPGQYVSVIFPLEGEYPLSIGDYYNNILTLHIESKRIVEKISIRSSILIKGPLGKPLDIEGKKVVGISSKRYCYDLNYPLIYSMREGKVVKLYCIDSCECKEIPITEKIETGDMTLVSLPLELIKKVKLPENSYIYMRWVKMNCMLGVCGACEFNGYLPCIQGPFMRLDKVVDKR